MNKDKVVRKLKDKEWKVCDIHISRLVRQDTDGIITTNKTLMYLVTIKGRSWWTGFNAKSPRELWKRIKEETYI